MPTPVSRTPPLPPSEAAAWLERRLALETDCEEVRESLRGGAAAFVVLDVRGAEAFAGGHVPGAVGLPHAEITAERMMAWPHDTLLVVYGAGPQSADAERAALALARLGRPVKVMRGGIAAWAAAGFPLAMGTEREVEA